EPVHLSDGIPLLQFRIRRGDVVHRARADDDLRPRAAARSAGTAMKSAWRYALASIALFAALAPIYWLISISLKKEIDQFAYPPLWWNFTPTLGHYHDAFVIRAFGRFLGNSILVAACSTLVALPIGTPAAYALARFRWPGEWGAKISFWILSTRMLPPIVTIVPLFLMMRELRLLNSLAGLGVVYTAFNLPFVIWMMRGFFEEIPPELEEAAMLDGESRAGALVHVVLPLARPGLAATAIFCAIVAWNEFLFALILTQT